MKEENCKDISTSMTAAAKDLRVAVKKDDEGSGGIGARSRPAAPTPARASDLKLLGRKADRDRFQHRMMMAGRQVGAIRECAC
jgi:hypothetical protein